MSELALTIVFTLRLLAFTGECASAQYYPVPAVYPTSTQGGESTGYAVIDDCALPTTVGMDEQTILETYLDIVGD